MRPKDESTKELFLVLENQPEDYIFLGETFLVDVLLVDTHKQVLIGVSYDLNLRLLIHPTMQVLESTVSVAQINPITGKATIPIAFSELSSNHGNHGFCFEVSADKLDSVVSRTFKTVTHKLVLAHPLPNIWYKDQGGRENCIEAVLRVKSNSKSSNTSSSTIPLSVALIYENEKDLDEKNYVNVLSVHSESNLELNYNDSKSNQAIVKFRIEDVSKNHQSRGFCLLVEPKLASQHDIAPVVSTPITVKSKPNPAKKRKSKRKSEGSVNSLKLEAEPISNMEDTSIELPVPAPKRQLFANAVTDRILAGPETVKVAANWCDEIKNVLCEYQELCTKRNLVEAKLWNLLGMYGEVAKNLNNSTMTAKVETEIFSNRPRVNSLSLVPTFSTEQLVAGYSTELLGGNSTTINMIVNELKNFSENSCGLSREPSLLGHNDSSKLFELFKEYERSKK